MNLKDYFSLEIEGDTRVAKAALEFNQNDARIKIGEAKHRIS